MLHEFGAPIVAIFEDLNFMSNEITGMYYCSGSPLESTLEVLTNIDYAEDAQFFTSDPDNGTVLHFFTSPVSVVEMEELDWVKVYPTTTNEQVYVDVIYTHCTYEIYDALGKLLVSGVLDKGLNTIDLSDLVSGIYFVRTKTDDNHITTRVFKQ
jgi:hypothetical protein